MGGELGGMAMQGEHLPWRNQPDHLDQLVEVGMVAEGEGGVGVVTEPAPRIERPSGKDGHARRPEAAPKCRNVASGRGEHDMAPGAGRVEP